MSKFKSNLYMNDKLKFANGNFNIITNENKYLYALGKYPTKIKAEDFPNWYIYVYIYKRYGYLSAKGVQQLLYVPNYVFDNHLHKDDLLFISYSELIEPYRDSFGHIWYKGYEHILSGSYIEKFVDGVKEYSGYDVDEIKSDLKRKKEWYESRNC